MPVRRTALVALPLAFTATLLVAPAASAAPRIDVPAPEAGTCWNYTYKQASHKGYTGTPIACDQAHTIETVVTLEVPGDVAAKGNNSRELILWVDARCQVEVNKYAGVAKPDIAAPGTRTWYFWYTPTQKQWKSGAQWVSCAAASVPGKERADKTKPGTLVPVTGSIAGTPKLSKPITFTTEYGTGTYTFRKPMTSIADRPFPGNDLQNRAASFCEKEFGHTKFFWYGPNETEWVQGYTAVRCYTLKKS